MSRNIVTFISTYHEQDEVAHEVLQGVLCIIVQPYILYPLQLVVDALSNAMLCIGLREYVQRTQCSIPVGLVLFKQQIFNLITFTYDVLFCGHR